MSKADGGDVQCAMRAPPAAARALIVLGTPSSYRETLLGDLEEEYHSVALPSLGLRRARRWYWGQVVRSFGHLCRLRVRMHNLGRGMAGIVAGLGGFLGSLLGLAALSSFFVPVDRIVLSDLGRFGWLLIPTVNAVCLVGAGFACERVAPTRDIRLPSLAWLATTFFILTRYDAPIVLSWFVIGVVPGLPAAWLGAWLARQRSVRALSA